MVIALLEILESGERPPQTVWFLAAGDEEYAQTGIKQVYRRTSGTNRSRSISASRLNAFL